MAFFDISTLIEKVNICGYHMLLDVRWTKILLIHRYEIRHRGTISADTFW